MKEKEKWYKLMEEYCESHVYEVSVETSDKWMQMLFEKRYVNFIDYYEEQIEFKTKKAENEFKKNFKETWLNKLKEYQVALKKAKSEEEKEELKKNGVKRKPTSTNKKSKK